MANDAARLTTTEFAVLGLLSFRERSGYDLARAAARSIGYMWAPSRSQIYKVLPRLVGWGLADVREVAQERRPDKAVYRISGSGLQALASWVEEVDENPAGGIGVFMLKLFFGGVADPEAVGAQLEAYRGFVRRRLAAYEEMERNVPDDEPLHSRIMLQHGIARARATLEWAEYARRALAAESAAAPQEDA
ncbi:MAG TPA: PadR family transcriptional regulator [Gaiellaceae bacterium]